MANWNTLKAAIANAIKTNGNQEITGQLLQNVLTNVVTSVGENATFAGVATPTTNPGTPDGPVFYFATEAGDYANFNGISLIEGETAILQWKNNIWVKNNLGLATKDTIDSASYNYTVITRPFNVKIKTNSKATVDNNIEVEFTGNVAIINAIGSTITFGKSGDSFTIPPYKTLFYDIEAAEVKVGDIRNDAKKIVLLHNEAGKIASGVFSPFLLHSLIEQKVPYHVASPIDNADGRIIIKYPKNYADYTYDNDSTLYLHNKIRAVNLFFDNGIRFNFNLDNIPQLNNYIAIKEHSSLVYDIYDNRCKVVNFTEVSSEVIVLLHNEPNSVGGILATYLYNNKAISDMLSDIAYIDLNKGFINFNTGEIDTSDGKYGHSEKIMVYPGTGILVTCACGDKAAVLTIYDLRGNILCKMNGRDEHAVHTYLYYNPQQTVYVVVSAISMYSAYYSNLSTYSSITSIRLLSSYESAINASCIACENLSLFSIRLSDNDYTTLVITLPDSEYGHSISYYNSPYGDANELYFTGGEYIIEDGEALVYDYHNDVTKVVALADMYTTTLIVLAYNENGKISFGILANYLNAMLEEKRAGKKMLCIGDSITDYGYYANPLAGILKATLYNRGLSGTTVADSSVENSFCERLDKPSDNTLDAKYSGFPTEADLVLVLGGVNDWGRIRDQELGTFNGAVDRTTFYGAWHYLLRGLKIKYPSATICVLNLYHLNTSGAYVNWREIEYNNPDDESEGWTECRNNKGNTYEDYRTAIEKVATFYGCHIIDLANCGMSFLNSVDFERYTDDGLHPNAAGGVLIAEYIAAQLKAIN